MPECDVCLAQVGHETTAATCSFCTFCFQSASRISPAPKSRSMCMPHLPRFFFLVSQRDFEDKDNNTSKSQLGANTARNFCCHVFVYSSLITSTTKTTNKVNEVIKEHPADPVPMCIRNAPTGLMKQLGYGAEYKVLQAN